jgi:hypothetical protein
MSDADSWRFKSFGPDRVSASSRVIPSPTNTNWNNTFAQNNPASPQYGSYNKIVSTPTNNNARSTSSLGNQSQPSLYAGEDFRDRFTSPVVPPDYEPKNMTRHQNLYGWGNGSPSATDKKWTEQSYA